MGEDTPLQAEGSRKKIVDNLVKYLLLELRRFPAIV